MTRLPRIFRDATFGRQLTIVVAVAVMSLALVSSLTTSWHGSRLIRLTLLEQGLHVAEDLARRSKLALLYDSEANAIDAADVALTFPDVVALEIRRSDHRVLTARGTLTDAPDPVDVAALQARKTYLEAESEDSWRFVAPVFSQSGSDSPFEVSERQDDLLGYVRVVQSKATLTRLRDEVFAANFTVSFFFALLFLVVVRLFTNRLSRPLNALSAAMARAEAGVSDVRAELAGPKDIENMAHAFNSMMAVLEERERELRTARDDALKFARLKADFAATVSHEIRTPLNGVVGTLGILMATELPKKQRQFVEIAWDSAQYLLDLINNILDFSRLEAGKVEIERIEFGVAHLVEDVIELVSQQAVQKGLELGYLVSPEIPPRLKGDPRRLRQVLINLVGNAVKFTDSGEIEVLVVIDRRAAAEWTLRFEVVDSGIGIDPAEQADIFESFTQADTSTTRRHGGSGLGLAISRQLVGLMGGEIAVSSTPGHGSRFWFTVPLAPLAEESAPMSHGPKWQGLRVLVADESEIVRRFLQQNLIAWGFDCQSADETDATMGELRAATERGQPYHAVILGTAFSMRDGRNLAARIRSEHGSDLRLILINRYGPEDAAAATEADAYLAKPLRIERLREALVEVLGNGGEPSADATPPRAAPAIDIDCRILVVEDNRTNQAIARGMLSVLRCRSEVAENGQEALRAFRRRPWDLILMDCNMPDMDGYQVTGAIRALEDEHGTRTPIVAMTANVQSSDVEKCLAAGMDDHLAKPLMLDRLSAALECWIPAYVAAPRQAAQGQAEAPASAAPGQQAEPLDQAVLAKLREALGDSIGQAIQPFLEDMPGYHDEMDRAAGGGEGERLRHAAHAVKGAAGNLGAGPLAAVARDIEDLAMGGQLDAARAAVARVRSEYAAVRKALLAEMSVDAAAPVEDAASDALVLVVDDDRSTRAALRYALQRSGFRVEEATDGAVALKMIERIAPDVVLMDAVMPVMDGFTACARLQQTPGGKNIPVLMITALDDQHSIERAFAAGASDYISKPIHLAVVNQRVRRVVEANRAEQHVRHLAFNDALTGLPNRLLFADHLNSAIDRAESRGQSLAVLFLDLDRFKFVNDTLGHEIGDRLLQSVARRIKHCVRASDSVARLGGDEFTVLLSELPEAAAAASAAEKICRSLTSAFDIDGHDIFVSASIGISIYPGDGTDVSTLLRRADTAMYRAKRGGRGFEFYEAGMEATVAEHLRMESSLRRALERNELVVYYQPKADARSGRINGMEALVRWQHPTRGLISPMEFIPLAEETGQIIPIGEWVLRTACAQAKAWLEAGMSDFNMAVNLSGSQLQSEFAELVETVLRETRLDARHLTLEITESVLMEHARETVATLQKLKAIGLRLEIDDFGTGYSSLAYLKRFPVDALKVDRTFIRDVTDNPDDAALVTGIIALAHSLRLQVVAEGVETQEQLDFLASRDCDCVQGYLLSEPIPAAEFERRILMPNFPECVFAR